MIRKELQIIKSFGENIESIVTFEDIAKKEEEL